jgi:hypothetical protein
MFPLIELQTNAGEKNLGVLGGAACYSGRMKTNPTRRSALKAAALGGMTLAAGRGVRGAEWPALYKAQRGRIRQSVVPWCFRAMPARELMEHAVNLGLKWVELIGMEHWPLLKEKGMGRGSRDEDREPESATGGARGRDQPHSQAPCVHRALSYGGRSGARGDR